MAQNSDTAATQLQTLLVLAREFTLVWCEQVRRFAGEKDRDPVMRLYQEGMVNAWESLARELTQTTERLDAGVVAEIDRYIAAAGIITMVQNARDIAASGQLGSAPALFDLGTIIEKIKDLIQAILKCLGIDLGCLIDILINFIDNILRLFTGRVSREYADYYYKIEEQAFRVRLRLMEEHERRHNSKQ